MELDIRKILVPIDFSDYSKNSLKYAASFANNLRPRESCSFVGKDTFVIRTPGELRLWCDRILVIAVNVFCFLFRLGKGPQKSKYNISNRCGDTSRNKSNPPFIILINGNSELSADAIACE